MAKRYPFALIKERLAASKVNALDFAMGRRSVPLPGSIESWVHANSGLALKPSNRDDMVEFADAAAAYLAREYHVNVPAARILPTPGGRQAMTAFIACMLNSGDAVMVTEPGYPAFARLATHRHAKVIEVALDPQNAFAPDLSVLSTPGHGPLRVISINYPNNPTGAKLSGAVITSLCKLVSESTILFNDATYGPLVYDEQPSSLVASEALNGRAVELLELHSFSKLFPLGPIAISFLVGSEATMELIKTYSEFAWSPLSRLQLQATTKCLRDSERLSELRGFFPLQLERLHEVLDDIGFRSYPTPAGVYVICDVPSYIDGKATSSAEEAADQLMAGFNLAVVPLDTPRRSYLRFSSLYQPEDLERLAGLRLRLA